jgi:thioesterase domain-containing protein
LAAADALTRKIRRAIPLSEAMQFTIDYLQPGEIRVSAPLQPNINIHGTGFAGSIYSLAILTGWALCAHILDDAEIVADLVVGRAEIAYRAPVDGDLECRCSAGAEQREAFLQGLRERGKGRLALDISVGDVPQASLQATFVAIARPGDEHGAA